MNEDQEEKTAATSLLEAWMKTAAEFWGSMARMWPGVYGVSKTPATSKEGEKSRASESWDAALKLWQTLYSVMSEPGAMDSLFRGIKGLPEILMKMAQAGGERYFHLQQQWVESAGRLGQRAEAYKFENIDRDVFKGWTEIYENEFRKFLSVPQLGLTRFYQERTASLIDKFSLFQTAMGEFMHLLYLPMEKSFKVMQEELEKATREGRLPHSSQEYYRMWLKILEGHYMTLFKSSEYTQVMSKTLDAMEEYTVAREAVLRDILQMLQLPTNKDMDDLYKELYLLKKRINQLEKRLDQ